MNSTRIFLNTWGAYNEGSIGFGWFTPDEARTFIDESLENETFVSKYGEEFFIADIDNYLGVDFGNLDYANIEDVCETIETLEDMDDDEQAKVIGLMEFGDSLQEAIDSIDDCYYYESEIAYDDYIDDMADECYLYNVPDQVKWYFDYDAFRRDYKINANYLVLNNGAVIERY